MTGDGHFDFKKRGRSTSADGCGIGRQKGWIMIQRKQGSSLRTLVLFMIFVPVIAYLVYFSIKKNAESESRAAQCYQQCTDQGYSGYDFKWNVLSGPVCRCLGEIQN